ncbi:MAG: hypothetical protein N3D17_06235 [bacterium]|nr:hypothetical protein [bacterium]
MKKVVVFFLVFICFCFSENYRDRFLWVFGFNLTKDDDVEKIVLLIKDASQNNYNGIVLSGGLDSLSRQDNRYLENLEKIKSACQNYNVELIPSIFSIGYGGGILNHDRNLAEGLPVKDTLFVVKGNEGIHIPEGEVKLLNGGFEEYEGNKVKGYRFHDEPGKISFVDTEIKHTGNTSLRFENFKISPYGHGRIMQEIKVLPYRCYRLSIWIKTENLRPSGNFRLLVLAGNRDIAPRSFNLPSTTDWRKLTMIFNSMEYDSLKVYAGIWEGKEGRFWIDDWRIEEVGLYNVLRRPGTPVVIRSEDGSVIYEEGKDYGRITDPYLNPYRREFDYPEPKIKILPGGRIKDGQYLRVSWYHPMLIYDSQVTVCMAETLLYEIFDLEARLLWEKVKYKKVILNADEIRMGGTCKACEGRNMAELLGECIKKQVEILKKYNPEVEVYVWSDMFDPSHNATPNYYLVKGDFTNSWSYIPKDIIIAVWGGKPREKSLRFFSEQGFKILIANYYDSEDLEDVKKWIEVSRSIPDIRGFMYTTWERKYNLLPEYGRIIFQKD